MDDLKPCPFCGWDKVRIISRYLDTKMRYVENFKLTTEHKRYYVRCNRCHAHGGSVSGYIQKSFVKFSVKNDWEAADLFGEDPPEETEPPKLPSFVRTKDQMEEKAINLWNMRRVSDGTY